MAQPCCEVPCTLYLAPIILRSLLVTARASCLHTRSRWALCLCQTLERRKESFITALPERLLETAGLKWKTPVNSFLLLRVGNHQSCGRLRFLDNYWRHRGTSIGQNALPSVWASPGWAWQQERHWYQVTHARSVVLPVQICVLHLSSCEVPVSQGVLPAALPRGSSQKTLLGGWGESVGIPAR